MAYASYSLRLVNAGRRFFQIHSRRIEFKCLIYRLIADDIFLVNIGSGQTLGSARASRAGDGALAIADLRNPFGEAPKPPRRGACGPQKEIAKRNLLRAKRFHRIDQSGAIGGKQARQQCCYSQDRQGGAE